MRALAVLLLLALPGLAQAQPFDLAALRAEWPGYPLVVIEQGHDFELIDGSLRVTSERQIAILTDDAREGLALFETTRSPGCQEPGGIDIVTTGRDGVEQRTTAEELAKIRLFDHSDPDRASVAWKGPRRGIVPGALLKETMYVDYPPACTGGLVGAVRTLGHPLGPVLKEWVTVRCAGDGCHVAVDRDEEGTLYRARDGEGVVYRREGVEPLPPESHFPPEDRPRIFVSSSDDPLAVATHLAPRLREARAQAARLVPSYLGAAKKEQGEERDAAARIARFLSELPILGGDEPFWQAGFGFSDPPKAGGRPMTSLEWWAVASAALAPHGGVPVLVDTRSHLDPPDIGNVAAFGEVGVLVPGRFVLLRGEFLALTGESAARLAGLHAIQLDDAPKATRFQAAAALNHHRWTGTVELTVGDYLKYTLDAALQGSQAATLREGHTDRVHGWKRAIKKRRRSESERDRTYIGQKLLRRDISLGTVEPVGQRLDAVTVGMIFSRAAEVQRGEGVVSLVVPLPLRPELEHIVSLGERHRPLKLEPVDVGIDLLVKTPEGHALAGLPASRTISEGPVRVEWSWEADPEGVRMRLQYRVDGAVLEPEFAGAVHAAAELVRRAMDPYLLFVEL